MRESREVAYRGVLPAPVVDWMSTQLDRQAWSSYLRTPRARDHRVLVVEMDSGIGGDSCAGYPCLKYAYSCARARVRSSSARMRAASNGAKQRASRALSSTSSVVEQPMIACVTPGSDSA